MRSLDLPRALPKKLAQMRSFPRADTGLKRIISIIFRQRVNWPLVHARGRRYSHDNDTVTRTWQSFHTASGCLADDAVYRNNRVHRFVAMLGRDYIGTGGNPEENVTLFLQVRKNTSRRFYSNFPLVTKKF